MDEDFTDVLNYYVQRAGLRVNRIATEAGINRQTFSDWVTGRTKEPQHWEDIAKLVAVLDLTREEFDRLLQAAHHPTVSELLQSARVNEDEQKLKLLEKLLELWGKEDHPYRNAPFQAPPRVPYLVRREPELKKLKEILHTAGAICVIHGMAGVGKTALAITAAYDLRSHFYDGVLWARLDVSSSMAILCSFADAYGQDVSRYSDVESCGSVVRGMLANKRVLIVLDNASHTEQVSPLLPPTTDTCAVIITTQNRKLLAERAITLSLRPFDEHNSLALVAKVIDEKRTTEEGAALKKIISLVGGLPLWLMIIASVLAQIDDLTIAEYYDALKDESTRLSNLTGLENKNALASLELSYKHLSLSNQRIFVILSLFKQGDLSAEAIAYIADIPLFNARMFLNQLFTRSLVEVSSQTEERQEGDSGVYPQSKRYRLHDLLLLFAAEKAPELLRSEMAQVQLRTAVYYANLAQENTHHYQLLEREWENMATAVQWIYDTQQWLLLYQAVSALTFVNFGVLGFLDAHGYWLAASEFLQWVLKGPVGHNDPLIRAILLFKLGAFTFRQTHYVQAETYFQDSLSILDTLPDSEEIRLYRAYGCEFMSRLFLEQHDGATAEEWSQRAIATLQTAASQTIEHEMGYLYISYATILGQNGRLQDALKAAQTGLKMLPDRPTAARVSACLTLGTIYSQQGDREQAMAYFQKGIVDAEQIGDYSRLARLWQNRAIEADISGDFSGAVEYNQKALQKHQQIGDTEKQAVVLANLGLIYVKLGEDESAHIYLDKAFQLAQSHPFLYPQAITFLNRARLHLRRGKISVAEEAIKETADICEKIKTADLIPELRRSQAEVALFHNQIGDAMDHIEASLKAAQDSDNPVEEGISWRVKGRILAAQKNFSEAKSAFQKSIDLLTHRDDFELAESELALAKFYLAHRLGDPATGRTHLKNALETFEKINARRKIASIQALLKRRE